MGAIAATTSDLYYTIAVSQNAGGPSEPYLGGSVMRVPLGGGPSTQVASGYLFTRPVVGPTSVILGERGGIYPINRNDAIASVPLSGGPATTVMTLSTGSLINGLATDGTYVYFTDQVSLQVVPLAPDSGAASALTLTTEQPNVIGAFGQRLIFIVPQGAVASLPLPPRANSTLTMLGTSAAGATEIMPCGSDACWLGDTNTLQKINPAGGAPISIATLTGAIEVALGVAFDGTSFYAIGINASGSEDSLERIPADGSCPAVIVHMPFNDGGDVAVDDECVYWLNSEGIFSLAKTAQGPFNQ